MSTIEDLRSKWLNDDELLALYHGFNKRCFEKKHHYVAQKETTIIGDFIYLVIFKMGSSKNKAF